MHPSSVRQLSLRSIAMTPGARRNLCGGTQFQQSALHQTIHKTSRTLTLSFCSLSYLDSPSLPFHLPPFKIKRGSKGLLTHPRQRISHALSSRPHRESRSVENAGSAARSPATSVVVSEQLRGIPTTSTSSRLGFPRSYHRQHPCLHEKKMGCWQGDGAMHARLPVSPTSQTENVRRWRCETQDGGRGDTWRPAHDFSWPGCPMAAPIPTETRDSGNGDHPERHRTTHPKRRGRDDRPVLSAERAGVQRRRAW